MQSKRQVRVAIVGSGMAGLVTAYLLHRDPRQRYHVKVFESGNTLSLDSASVSIPNAARTSSDRVDLPMRAFAGGFYSNLKSMYDHIGVQYHSQPFLFEFAKAQPAYSGRSADTSYFVHASNFHQRTARPCTTARVSYLLDVAYLLLCYTWFSICCFLIAPRREETLDHYLRRVWIPQRFVTYYLLPLISSVSTCPHKSLLLFPASDMTEYKRRTHGAPHYTVSNGVKTVQERLIRGVSYELGAFVSSVEPQEKGVKISWGRAGDATNECRTEYFDRVVIAVAPNIVGQIFEPLRYHMTRIPTAEVESVVHTDRGVLELENPITKDADSHGTQLIYLRTSTEGSYKTESLHVQECGAVVTTCPFSPIDPSLIIHSAKFTRVLRSPESQKIVNSIFREDTPNQYRGEDKSVPLWKNGDDNVWLAGGWCWDGMVLLEGCVVSAMRIADDFDVDVPWRH